MAEKTLSTLVKEILTEVPKTRSSDKALIWEVLRRKGCLIEVRGSYGGLHVLNYDCLLDAPCFESITRERRALQEDFPYLEAVEEVKKKRTELENLYHKSILSDF